MSHSQKPIYLPLLTLSPPLRSPRAPRRHCRLPLASRKRIRWGSAGSSAMWSRAVRARRRLVGSRPASTAAAVEKTCRAVVVPRFGGPEVLEIRQGVPVPDLKPREVLVRARAVSINPLDLRMRSGYGRSIFEPHLPLIPGRDISGEVAATGTSISSFSIGQEVFGALHPTALRGTYADYAVLPLDELTVKPPTLSHTEASAIPFAALTAWRALHGTARISEGQRVLVIGGGGAVGLAAVQLAVAAGCGVSATCGAQSIERVMGAGAEQAIDYTAEGSSKCLFATSITNLQNCLILDVKALGRCALVSRRFHDLVPLVDSVFVRVDCVIADDLPQPSADSPQRLAAAALAAAAAPAVAGTPARGRGALAHIARLLLGGITRPIQALGQILSPAAAAVSRRSSPQPASPPAPTADVSHHSPSEVLRAFKELRRLHIELPTGELGIDDGVLLKWKADFGSTLGSCVILGASSVSSKPLSTETAPETASDSSAAPSDSNMESEESGGLPESLYTNGGLKLRVVWTISSLIAASARHYLLQPIIANHVTLHSLHLTDTDGQGVLTMNKKQLQELRVRPVSASGSSHRTLMPALSMRLYYAPHVELPGGTLLKGATLVAIRPSEDALREDAGAGATCWISEAFEEPYRSAAKVLLKRRPYCLEMNSF